MRIRSRRTNSGADVRAAAGEVTEIVALSDDRLTRAPKDLGLEAYNRGDFGQAVYWFEEATRRPNPHPWRWVWLSRAQGALGKHDEALASAERALERDPDWPPGLLHLADILAEHGLVDRAVDALERLVEVVPRDADVMLRAARRLVKLAAWDSAARATELVLTAAPEDQRALRLKREVDAAISSAQVARMRPAGPITRPDLRVACILDDFSETAFRYEFDCLRLHPREWRDQVADARPDLLFVESAWRGNGGAWRYMLSKKEGPHPILTEVVAWCQSEGIPTVFWNKEDPPNFDLFVNSAAIFDWVFTVDEDCVPRYRRLLGHDRVAVLPFAVQPRVHNPVRGTDSQAGDVAFAGTYFAEKHPERREQMEIVLDPARAFNLHIFARMGLDDPRYRFPEKYKPHVVGSLPYEEMVEAYKKYKVFLNVNSVTSSRSMCARRIFELSACATPVLSGPSEAIEPMMGPDTITVTHSRDDTRLWLGLLLRNKELRDRKAHLALRKVLTEHTYRDRVDHVLSTIGLGAGPPRRRVVSMVVPTNRPEQLSTVIDNARRQRYCDLELVVVLHGLDRRHEEQLVDDVEKAGLPAPVVVSAPSSLTLGECMNLGIDASTGSFVAKVDDDNFYGPEYLADLVHAFDYTDAGVVGKWAHYVYLGGQNCTVLRFPDAEHRFTRLVQGGTMLMKRDVATGVRFQALPRAVDTTFLDACKREGIPVYASDRFNFISVRRPSPDVHTWRVTDEHLMKAGEVKFYGWPEDHVVL